MSRANLSYTPDRLSGSEGIFDRLLVHPIPEKMGYDHLETIISAMKDAANGVV